MLCKQIVLSGGSATPTLVHSFATTPRTATITPGTGKNFIVIVTDYVALSALSVTNGVATKLDGIANSVRTFYCDEYLVTVTDTTSNCVITTSQGHPINVVSI